MNATCAALLVAWIGTETPRTLRIARSAIVQDGWFGGHDGHPVALGDPRVDEGGRERAHASPSALSTRCRATPGDLVPRAGASPLPAITSSRTWATCRACDVGELGGQRSRHG